MALNRLKRLIDGDDKLELAANQILAGNSDGLASAVAAGVSNTNIATNAVTSAKIKDGEVTGPKIAALCVSTGRITASAIDGTKVATGAISALALGASAVITTKLAYALHRISFIASGALSLTASITVASGAILAGALQLVSTVGAPGLQSVMVTVRTDQLANGRLIVSITGTYTDQTAIFEGVIINPA